MNILLVRLRLIGDVVFTTPAIRAIRRHYPDARITYIVEEEAAAVVRHNPHLDDVIVACSPHAPGRLRADLCAHPAAAPRTLRSCDRLSRRAAQLAAHVARAARRSASATKWPAGAGCTRRACRVRARCGRDIRSISQWDVLLPLGIAPPDPETDATEMPDDPAASAAVARRLAEAGVSGPQSDRGARQRGQSLPALAAGVVRRVGVPAGVKRSEAPYHPDVRSVGCRCRVRHREQARAHG